jgi:dTDP-4-amino-4,6-dideoxygalactose transaminase
LNRRPWARNRRVQDECPSSFCRSETSISEPSAEIDEAIRSVVSAAAFLEGAAVSEFEKEFAAYCQVREAIAVDSGSAALQLALIALGIHLGDEVIVPTNTFIATAAAVSVVGARPVFVDSDSKSWLMDINQVESRITNRTKAIIAVHLYGNSVDMNALMSLARKRSVPVIEDACQAHGAWIHGGRAGSVGIAGCFSFYPAKNLGAFGDGGLVTTNDAGFAERIRRLRNHGRTSKYEHSEVGFNYRMDTLQAAILRAKLSHLDKWNERRRELAAGYTKSLGHLPMEMPESVARTTAVHHLFPICYPQRDAIAQFLSQRGIDTGVHYPLPLHLQPAFFSLGHKRGDFPVSEKISAGTLSLPIFPEMTDEQLGHVCDSLAKFFMVAPARAQATC